MSDVRTTELLDLLERLQQDKADAEARISESSDRIAGMEAAMGESSAASDRVAELEKQLEERTVEIEETDEKYIDVNSPCSWTCVQITFAHYSFNSTGLA